MKTIHMHEYYASSPGIDWNVLVGEAKRDAAREFGTDWRVWKLEGMYEYFREVYDERGKVIDLECKVVVRYVP